MASPDYDVVVIGGGIVGLATAFALRERCPDLRMAVLEKEPAIGLHQTSRNSMVMHSGVYYRPGSYKARFCLDGRPRLVAFCEAYGIPHKPCSKVVVAVSDRHLPALQELYEWGTANGVPGLERIGPQRLKELEPHVRGLCALYVPQAGAVNFLQVAQKLADLLVRNGVQVLTHAPVFTMTQRDGRVHLATGRGDLMSRYVVNCAGLQADRIARTLGMTPSVQLIPFRILRFLLKPERRDLVRSVVYPIPDPGAPQFGVHATRRFDGHVEVGPGIALALAREGYAVTTIRVSEVWDMLRYRGFWKMLVKKRRAALAELGRATSLSLLVRDLRRILPDLTRHDLTREPSADGILAPAFTRDGTMVEDFVIEEGPRSVHVLNAPSPAATAALAIGRHLTDVALRSGFVTGR